MHVTCNNKKNPVLLKFSWQVVRIGHDKFIAGLEFETKWKGWRGGDLEKFAHFLFWGCPEAGLLKFNSRRPVHYSHYRVKIIEISLPFFMDMFSVLLS